MSGRAALRRRAFVALVVSSLLVVVSGACGPLDTVFLGTWPRGVAGSGGEVAQGGSGGSLGAQGGGGQGGERDEAVLPTDEELWSGAVRLVAASSRLTVGSDGTVLTQAPFQGASPQMWLLQADGECVRLVHDETSNCLAGPEGLTTCANAPAFGLRLMRPRTDERPSLYEVEDDEGRCLVATVDGIVWGACGEADAGFYLEPSGWGRRPVQPAELDVQIALIQKTVGSTSSGVALDIPASNVSAVTISFEECTTIWFESLTDGRVAVTGQAFTSTRPIEQAGSSCSHAVPAASDLAQDFEEFVPSGAFDGVVVYWRPGNVDGGWSCSGLGGPHGGGLGYQAYGDDDAGWSACTPVATAAFLQAYLAMAAQFYEERGVPAPEGAWTGGVPAQYEAGPFEWNHWRRDYLLGRVIRADGTYGGLGPRAFRLGTIRATETP